MAFAPPAKTAKATEEITYEILSVQTSSGKAVSAILAAKAGT